MSIEVDVARIDAVILDIPVGQLNVSGTAGQAIEAEVVITCSKYSGNECDNNIFEEIAWFSKLEGDHASLGLIPPHADRYDDISVAVNVSIPRDKKLTINFNYGDLVLEGTSACLDVNVKAGNAKLNLKEKSVSSAILTAAIGDVSLKTPVGTAHGRRSKLVGAKLEWNEGAGACDVQAKVFTGNIELILE